VAGRRAAAVDDRCADPEMLRPHYSTVPNWGRTRAVKTNWLVYLLITLLLSQLAVI